MYEFEDITTLIENPKVGDKFIDLLGLIKGEQVDH